MLDPAEIDVGVTSDDAPVDVLRAEFLQVLDIMSPVASLVGASVYDVQLGRSLLARDDDAVRGFAG